MATGGEFASDIDFADGRKDDDHSYHPDPSKDKDASTRADINLYGGGAILLLSYSRYCTIVDSVFEGNSAPFGIGGAILSYATNNGLSVISSLLSNNSAVQGGGIAMFSHNGNVFISLCQFTGNRAVNGGAIASLFYNVLYVENSVILNNVVSGKGGGIYCNSNNYAVQVTDSLIANNSATYGAGSYFGPDHDVVMFTNSTIHGNNVLYDGGGVYCDRNVAVFMDHCTMASNTAGHNGGALYQSDYKAEIYDCMISDNLAINGGGLYVANVPYCKILGNSFLSNFASVGAAVYLTTVNMSIVQDNKFLKNMASICGGGVYWLHGTMLEPHFLNSKDNYFIDNWSGEYGADKATEPKSLAYVNSMSRKALGLGSKSVYQTKVIIDSYENDLSIDIHILDSYDQLVHTDNTSYVYLSVKADADCDEEKAYLTGTISMQATKGVLSFHAFQAHCKPSLNLSLDITFSSSDTSLVTPTAVDLHFRSCKGENITLLVNVFYASMVHTVLKTTQICL